MPVFRKCIAKHRQSQVEASVTCFFAPSAKPQITHGAWLIGRYILEKATFWMVNVGKYTRPMDPMGLGAFLSWHLFQTNIGEPCVKKFRGDFFRQGDSSIGQDSKGTRLKWPWKHLGQKPTWKWMRLVGVVFVWLSSWWLNKPIWKICSSNWTSSPRIRGEHEKTYFKPPPRWDWLVCVFLVILFLKKPTLGKWWNISLNLNLSRQFGGDSLDEKATSLGW